MKTVILDGSVNQHVLSQRILTALLSRLSTQNHHVQTFLLRENRIGACAGDFFCWIHSPGQCILDDDNRRIAAAVATADLLIYLTPVTFGGYSSTLKKAIDHQIQNISPFFTTIDGETHHEKRYPRYPDFLVIGWQARHNPAAEIIFRHLVWRNSLNFYAPASHCEIVNGDPSEAVLASHIETALEAIEHRTVIPQPVLPVTQTRSSSPPRNTLLLVGSPRGEKSTSYAIGKYLMEQLEVHGIHTEIVCLYPLLKNPEKIQELLSRIDSADLTVLAFPLYVDTLPAPDMLLLEHIAAHRTGLPVQSAPHPVHPSGFVALTNCGFPEAHHNANALALCAEFALQTGFTWQGSLALGAGEGLVHGRPLQKLGARGIQLRKALTLAASALAQGGPIPTEAQKLISKLLIPPWLYRLFGGIEWRQQAKRWGVQKEMPRKPYQSEMDPRRHHG